MNQRKIWSDPKVRADRLPAAEEFLGRTMEMDDRDESEGRKMSVSKEEERSEIENARRCISIGLHWNTSSARTIVALSDENDRLRAERDEAVKLIERDKLFVDWQELLAILKGTP